MQDREVFNLSIPFLVQPIPESLISTCLHCHHITSVVMPINNVHIGVLPTGILFLSSDVYPRVRLNSLKLDVLSAQQTEARDNIRLLRLPHPRTGA